MLSYRYSWSHYIYHIKTIIYHKYFPCENMPCTYNHNLGVVGAKMQ